MYDDELLPESGMRIGFVELPDEALDLMSHFTQQSDVEVVIVVSQDGESYAVRMAEILQVPVLDTPNRLSFLGCTHVVVGPRPDSLMESLHELLEGTRIRLLTINEAFRLAGLEAPAGTQPLRSEETGNATQHFAPTAPAPANLSPPAEAPTRPSPSGPYALPNASPVARPKPPAPPQPGAPAGSTAPPPPEHVPVHEAGDEDLNFDAASLLGDDIRESLGSLAIDVSGNELLSRILDIAMRATHTQTGSIMLLDVDREHLRIAVSRGLPDEIAARVRERVGEGIAGGVFLYGEPRLVRGHVERGDRQIEGLRPGLREAAVVPILSGTRTIGVLCVNLESEEGRLTERTLALLERFAREASGAIIKAIRLPSESDAQRLKGLMRQVERLMDLDESLGNRLKAIADAVRRNCGAELCHVFIVDPLGRLELITPQFGVTSGGPSFQPVDRGLFGWVVRHGKPRILEIWDEETGDGAAVFLLPVATETPHALLVFETIPLVEPGSSDPLLALEEVAQRLGRMIAAERRQEAEELLVQIQGRIAEHSPRFGAMLPQERARAVLDFAVDLLDAETAVWVRGGDARPVWARSVGPYSVSLQSRFRTCLDDIARWVRRHGPTVGGIEGPGRDPEAPESPAPYAGIEIAEEGTVVLLVFPGNEPRGALSRVPAPVLTEALARIAGILPSASALQRPGRAA